MKNKKIIWIAIGVVVLVGVFSVFRLGGEDSWIQDERGVYVKHGVPSDIPDYVQEQKEAVECALELYNQEEEFNSQCLGVCGDYAVDFVHVPRNEEDDKVENQCAEYGSGEVGHFIEIDKNGEVVRIK